MMLPVSRGFTFLLACAALVSTPSAGTLPDGYWDQAQRHAVLDATRILTLDPDLSTLAPGERRAVEHLLAAGRQMQLIYERQLHPQAPAAVAVVAGWPADGTDAPARRELLDLYRLFRGPVASTLDNRREPFLPVAQPGPGKGVYPAGLRRADLDDFLRAHPERTAELADERSVVRRAEPDQLQADLAVLDRHPALDVLHPGLRPRLTALLARPEGFYAVPYAVAFAEHVLPAYRELHAAAEAVQADDAEFAGYLRHRARDLLTDDYEAGDAAWVTGRFGNLNAQIGAYETYDDELLGTRAFFSMSLLKRHPGKSDALQGALGGLQAIHDALPLASDRTVREQIPVGVYEVIADFGQARGGNTATILPNDAQHARRYGRVILLRDNIIGHPANTGQSASVWKAAMLPSHHSHLQPGGALQRTLWHEIGHYLGVDQTKDGRPLEQALQEYANLFEELKSDLVSLHAARQLHQTGYYDDEGLRSVRASGVLRVLQQHPPRADQPYQMMQLMQWNWYLANGLLRFDAEAGQLAIDYDRYHEGVRGMLAEVLAIQASGDRNAARAFINRWSSWDEALHGVIAARVRDATRHRFTIYRYRALGE